MALILLFISLFCMSSHLVQCMFTDDKVDQMQEFEFNFANKKKWRSTVKSINKPFPIYIRSWNSGRSSPIKKIVKLFHFQLEISNFCSSNTRFSILLYSSKGMLNDLSCTDEIRNTQNQAKHTEPIKLSCVGLTRLH